MNTQQVVCKLSGTQKACGNDFNIGCGFDQSTSLLELFDFLQKELDMKLNYIEKQWSKNDSFLKMLRLNPILDGSRLKPSSKG